MLRIRRLAVRTAFMSADVTTSRHYIAQTVNRLLSASLTNVAAVDPFDLERPSAVVHDVHVGQVAGRDGFAAHPDDIRLQDLLLAFMRLPGRVVATTRKELVNDARWIGSPPEIWLRERGLGDGLLGRIPLAERGALCVSTHRAATAPTWSPADVRLFRAALLALDDVHRTFMIHARGPMPLTDGLTRRHREVLDLLLNGRSVKEIARRLGLAENTVSGYVKSVYRSFGVHSRGELLSRFIRG